YEMLVGLDVGFCVLEKALAVGYPWATEALGNRGHPGLPPKTIERLDRSLRACLRILGRAAGERERDRTEPAAELDDFALAGVRIPGVHFSQAKLGIGHHPPRVGRRLIPARQQVEIFGPLHPSAHDSLLPNYIAAIAAW